MNWKLMSILMILFGQSKPTLGENWATYSSIYNDFFGTEIVKLLDLDSIVKKDNFIYVNTSGSLVRKRTEKNRVNCRKKTIQFVAKSPYVQSQSPPYKRVKKGVWSYPTFDSYDWDSDGNKGPRKQTTTAGLEPLYQFLCKGKRTF